MHVVIIGTMQHGFTFYGPFLSYDVAATWVRATGRHDSEWLVVPLETPDKGA